MAMKRSLGKSSNSELLVLSSYQWFSAMDKIIELVVEELLSRTSMVEYWISQLVVFQHNNKKRWVSTKYPWRECISEMLIFMSNPTMESFKGLELDRGYVQPMFQDFLEVTNGYEDAYQTKFTGIDNYKLRSLNEYHIKVGLKNGRDLMNTVSHVAYLNNQLLKLKEMIMGNYIRYVKKIAIYDASQSPHKSPEDVEQDYCLAMNRAINHFNKEKGTFKSYLDIWIRKSRNTIYPDSKSFIVRGNSYKNKSFDDYLEHHGGSASNVNDPMSSEDESSMVRELQKHLDKQQ